MTPDEASPEPVDEQLLAQMIAFDALLHAEADAAGIDPSPLPLTDDDEQARGRLLLLLRMIDAAEGAPGPPGAASAAPPPVGEDDEARTFLGRFQFLEDLGAGGFGFVVRARDRVLGREVALKMPLPERLLAPGDVRRSLREARAAARLDHRSIVRVYDAGEIGPLGYFIASEFCPGPGLRRWLRQQPGPVPARLAARWAAALADAVQHAHDRGILHRDIKPDNVILAPSADEPGGYLPRLTDFGLAKLLEEAGEETRSEARIGTPQYMAPEQVAGRRGEVGPAADVYAMGATLYEVLTGRPPLRGDTEAETLRMILDADPVPPRSLRPGLPRDLETICLKCLRKEPARRYSTAAELRDDLQRYLDGRPIVGRPVSVADRAWAWARRRPGVAALLGLVILLAGALVGGLAGWVTRLERHRQELELYVARADRSAEEARKQSRLAEERRRLADRLHHADGLRRARQALDARQFELAQDILDDLQPEPDEADPRGFAWRYLWRQAHRDFSQLRGHDAMVMGWAATADARALATWDVHGKVLIWDVAPGRPLDRPRAASPATGRNLSALEFSPDGRRLAGIEVAARPSIRLMDPATGSPIARLVVETTEAARDLRFDPDGRRVAVLLDRTDRTAEFCWWDLDHLDAGPRRRPIGDGQLRSRLSADGRWLGVAREHGVSLVDPWTGEVRRELPAPMINALWEPVFSGDGRHVAAVAGRSIVVWETVTGREEGRYELDGAICYFLLGARGRRLAVMDHSGYVTVHDRATGRRAVLTPGDPRTIRNYGMVFSPDETRLSVMITAVAGGAKPAEVWDVTAPRRLGTFPGRTDLAAASFFPDDRSLIVTGGIGPRVWRLDPPGEPDELAGHAVEAWAAAFSPDGRVLATGSDDTGEPRTIRLWDRATGRALASWTGHTATVAALAFSPDGRLLASGSLDARERDHPNVILWDATTHRRLAALEGHTDRVRSVAFSPDGQTLATAGDDATARLWDLAGRAARGILSGHSRSVMGVAFSPDGKTLATASNDATVRLWDVGAMTTRAILREMGEVHAVAFAPDGSLLASANVEGGIRLWDPATGQIVRTIHGQAEPLRCLAFSPNGRNLAAAGMGKIVRIWEISTGQEVLALDGHKAWINALTFAPDGQVLASCSHDGAVRLWQAGPIATVPSP